MAGFSTVLAGLTVGMAVAVASPSAIAEETDILPHEMPPGLAGLFFGESVKSAKKKCESYEVMAGVKGPKVFAYCTAHGYKLSLEFNTRGKLHQIMWEIKKAAFEECKKEVLERFGAVGRFEDKNGNEGWSMPYVGESGKMIGGVACAEYDDSAPTISFFDMAS